MASSALSSATWRSRCWASWRTVSRRLRLGGACEGDEGGSGWGRGLGGEWGVGKEWGSIGGGGRRWRERSRSAEGEVVVGLRRGVRGALFWEGWGGGGLALQLTGAVGGAGSVGLRWVALGSGGRTLGHLGTASAFPLPKKRNGMGSNKLHLNHAENTPTALASLVASLQGVFFQICLAMCFEN